MKAESPSRSADDASAATEPGEPHPPEPAPPVEAWLVWGGDPVETAWVEVDGDQGKVVAKQAARIISDGTRLWRIEERKSSIELLPCECEDPDGELSDEDCKSGETVEVPWLEAIALPGGEATAIVKPVGGQDYGNDVEYGQSIVGGVGAKLFVESSSSGYFCGAHGLYEDYWGVHDVASGEAFDPDLKAIGRRLPEEARRHAATELKPEVDSCDGLIGEGEDEDEENSLEDLMDSMVLAFVSVTADAEPSITWTFDHELPYVCSPDYGAQGAAETGLHPAGAPLGLGPPTRGQRAALSVAAGGEGGGWAQVTATGEERAALLEAFRGGAKPATPPPAVAKVDTGKLLNDARRATRAGKYEEALAALDALLAADPAHARGWSARGYAKLLSGDLAGAEKDLKTALTKKSGDDNYAAAIHFNLGMLAEKQGNSAAARKAYRRSNELRPSKQADAALARLSSD